MKISTALRRAAELLHENHMKSEGRITIRFGCCWALERATGTWYSEAVDFFRETIAPNKRFGDFWWRNPHFPDSANTEARIFALLLAAEVAKAEGK